MKLKSILLFATALMIAGISFGQSKVTTDTLKYTLVEEGTGAWCQYCTDGSQWLQQKIEPDFPRAVVASFHDDYGGNPAADAMTLAGNPYNDSTGYITGFPMGTVDRAPAPTSIGMGRSSWYNAVITRNALTPKFKVSMTSTYDSVTRVVSIMVTAKVLVAGTGAWRLNAYIVEDSIPSVGSGYAQSNAYGAAGSWSTQPPANTVPSWYAGYGSPVSPASRYAHMNVVRKILGKSIWGDSAFVTAVVGDSVSKTYTYTIPATSPSKYIKVIGLVQKYGTSTTDRQIENAIMARVRTMWKVLPPVGLTNITAMQDIQIFPNPAQNAITVKGMLENPSNVTLTVYNPIGQVLIAKEYKAGGSLFGEVVPVNNLSNGIYFMNITNDGGTITKQFTVSK